MKTRTLFPTLSALAALLLAGCGANNVVGQVDGGGTGARRRAGPEVHVRRGQRGHLFGRR